jgi:hypothetical protein
MSERHVGLDLSTGAFDMRGSSTPHEDARAGSDAEARRQFEAALHASEDGDDAAPASLPPPALASLLKRAPASAASRASTTAAVKRDLALLRTTLSGLFVGDGRGGRRQAAMQLAADILPGVTVTVYEDGGAWVADFVCADDDAREQLCAEADPLVREMAEHCARRSGWRVMTDDEEDLRLREFWADPNG